MIDRFSLTQQKVEGKSIIGIQHALSYGVSCWGYAGFERLVQPSPENAIKLESYTGIDEQVLRHQGSDFFGAAALSQTIAPRAVCFAYHSMKMAGMYKTAAFIDKNYRLLNSAVGFLGLGLMEYADANGNFSNLDLADMAAYGLGIATFCHGHDIAHLFKETLSDVFKSKTHLSSGNKANQTVTP